MTGHFLTADNSVATSCWTGLEYRGLGLGGAAFAARGRLWCSVQSAGSCSPSADSATYDLLTSQAEIVITQQLVGAAH